MFSYYYKSSIEVPITSKKVDYLFCVIQNLQNEFSSLLKSALWNFPGGHETILEKKDAFNKWLKEDNKDNFIIDIFSAKNRADYSIILCAQSIKKLNTKFGKSIKPNNTACLLTQCFYENTIQFKNILKFHTYLCNQLKNNFKLTQRPKFVPVAKVNKTFDKFAKLSKQKESYSSDVLKIVELLVDEEFRKVVIRTRQAKDPSLKNISSSTGLNNKTVAKNIAKALSAKLLWEQFNVICKTCNKVLARIKQKSAIREMVTAEFSCPGCKKPIDNNSLESIYVFNDKYTRLIDGSLWMNIYVKNILSPFGFGRRILSCIVDGPNELDIVANLDGDLVLMELKDNQFSMGHAYSFVGKHTQYHPSISIIISTQGIDADVKDYLSKTNVDAYYIENLKNLQSEFERVFSKTFVNKVIQFFVDMGWSNLLTKSYLRKFGHDLPSQDIMDLDYLPF
jgi:hypothetical protein